MIEHDQGDGRAHPDPSPTDGESADARHDEGAAGTESDPLASRGPGPSDTHPDSRDPASPQDTAGEAPLRPDVDEFDAEQGGYGVTVEPG